MKPVKNLKLIEKYRPYMKERNDLVELNIRGEKARKVAEIGEVVKWMAINEPLLSFQIPQSDFVKAYGVGKTGLTYVKVNLKKFGVLNPRVTASQDIVHIWCSKTATKQEK